MNKRIISMFLAVVMLILAVPVFAIPSFGAATNYKTTSTLNKNSNWPTLVDLNPELSNGTLGKWGVEPASEHGLFGDGWNFGGIVNGKFVPFYDYESAYSTLVYADSTAWTLPVFTLNGGSFGANKNNTAGFSYLAPYTGTVDVTATVNMFEWAVGKVGFAIMVDNVIVYPAQTEGTTTYLYADAVGTFTQNATLQVKAGQTIAFIYNNPENGNDDAWANNFSGTVTYTSIDKVGDVTYTADAGAMMAMSPSGTRGKIVSGESGVTKALTGLHAWSFGSMSLNGTFTVFDTVGSSHNWIGNSYVEGGLWGGNGGIQIHNQSLAATGANRAVALEYTAEFTGTVALSVTLFDFIADSYENGSNYYTVLHNGKVVWPASATAVNDTANAYQVANAAVRANNTVVADMTEAMKDLTFSVNKGDKISFAIYRPTNDDYQHVTFGPCVTYTSISYDPYVVLNFINAEAGTSNTIYAVPNADGTVSFTAPDAGDALGWFEIDSNGNIIDANAYNGTVINSAKTFYAFSKTATLAPGKSWPTVVNGKILYPSTIGFGKYNSAGTYTPFNNYVAQHQILDGVGQWGNTGSFLYVGENRFVNAVDGAVTIRWTALVDGKVEVDFTKLSIDRVTDGNAQMHSDTAFVIMKNGTVVWPKTAAGTTFNLAEGLKGKEGTWFYAELPDSETPTSAWGGGTAYETYATTGSLLETLNAYLETDAIPEIEVAAGDKVEIVFARIGTPHISVNAAVTYTEVAEDAELWDAIITKVPLYSSNKNGMENMPTLSQDNTKAVYTGAWTYVGYDKTSNNPADAFLLDTVINTDNGIGDGFYAKAGTGLWGDNGPCVRIRGGEAWGATGSISVCNKYTGAMRYTAEYSGLVDIDLTSVTTVGETVNNVAIAIFVDGNMIWPTAGGSYTDLADWYTVGATDVTNAINTADEAAYLKNVFVSEGSVVEFMVTATNYVALWLQRGTAIAADITYTSMGSAIETPVINNGSVTLNDKFAANFFVDVDELPEGATNVGAYVNGEFVAADEDGMVTLGGIAAKEFTDAITVQPTYTVSGDEITGETTTVTLAAMMMQYVLGEDVAAEVKNLAIATLNYAAAAQTYFAYNTENLANAALTDEQKAVAYTGFYDDYSEIVTNPTEARIASIYGVKLILNDTVDMAIYFQSDVDLTADNYCLVYSADMETKPTFATDVEIVKVGEGLYKAILTGFTPAVWGQQTIFGLANMAAENESMTVVSDALMYSVADYCYRMQGTEVDAVVDAMLALYEAANACRA